MATKRAPVTAMKLTTGETAPDTVGASAGALEIVDTGGGVAAVVGASDGVAVAGAGGEA